MVSAYLCTPLILQLTAKTARLQAYFNQTWHLISQLFWQVLILRFTFSFNVALYRCCGDGLQSGLKILLWIIKAYTTKCHNTVCSAWLAFKLQYFSWTVILGSDLLHLRSGGFTIISVLLCYFPGTRNKYNLKCTPTQYLAHVNWINFKFILHCCN